VGGRPVVARILRGCFPGGEGEVRACSFRAFPAESGPNEDAGRTPIPNPVRRFVRKTGEGRGRPSGIEGRQRNAGKKRGLARLGGKTTGGV